MIPVLVMTSDKYLRSLQQFGYLFDRYWGPFQDVRVICFKKPNFYLPPNFSIYSMGDMANYPINKWSNVILDYLQMHPYMGHFILMLEDYWITRRVDVYTVNLMCQYAVNHPEVLKVDLCADRMYAGGVKPYGKFGEIELLKSDYNSQYHMSLMTGVWNRDLFTSFVVPNETPWEVELNGTPRVAAAKDNVLVIGTKLWPVHHILAHRGGDPSKTDVEGLDPQDVADMTALGYFKTEEELLEEKWRRDTDDPLPFVDSRHSTS